MIVFAFDRDDTVSCGNPEGPVPLKWVKYLAHETEHEVWATGNQALKAEADIPGKGEMKDRLKDIDDLEEEKKHASVSARKEGVRALKTIFPDADRYIVVDDVDLSDLEDEGWDYYYPTDFAEEFRGYFEE